jgi:hypothetical protein
MAPCTCQTATLDRLWWRWRLYGLHGYIGASLYVFHLDACLHITSQPEEGGGLCAPCLTTGASNRRLQTLTMTSVGCVPYLAGLLRRRVDGEERA